MSIPTPQVATGPYSSSAKARARPYYLSGVTGLDVPTMTASSDVQPKRQAFANLKQVLNSEGLALEDVVKTTLFLTDMGDYAAVNEVYVGEFASPRPARSCVAVAELPRVADVPLVVEIEAIAVGRNPSR